MHTVHERFQFPNHPFQGACPEREDPWKPPDVLVWKRNATDDDCRELHVEQKNCQMSQAQNPNPESCKLQ
jgi:hypothetical protein